MMFMSNKSILGKNHGSIQQENQELILRLLSFPPKLVSRKELSSKTGLTSATITNVTKSLIEKNIIIEGGSQIAKKRGRPEISIGINPNGGRVIGVRLARNYIIGGLF